MRVALVALFAGGCAQIFGIDPTSASSPDAPPAMAHISFVSTSIGAQLTSMPLDLTGQTATFLEPDPTAPSGYRSVPGVGDGSGGWNGAVPTGDPLVDFTWPPTTAAALPTRQLWALPSRDVASTYYYAADPGAMTAPAGATLDLSVAISAFQSGMESFELQAIAPWSHHVLAGGELPAASATSVTTSIPYSSFTSLVSNVVSRVTSVDRLLLLRYVGPVLTGVFETSLDEMAGANAITGSLQSNAQDQMLDAAIDTNALVARYTPVLPVVGNPMLNWEVLAAPGAQQLALFGTELNGGPVALSDTTITKSYGNPFASQAWPALVAFSIYEARPVPLPPGQNLNLTSGMYSYAAAGTGLTLGMAAGLPQTITINQTPLTTDNLTVMLDPTKFASVTLAVDRPVNTAYELVLYEVLPGSPPALRRVEEMLAVDPSKLVLSPDAFQAGHLYTIDAITYVGGYVNAATGDLLHRSLPMEFSYNYSGVFTVANP